MRDDIDIITMPSTVPVVAKGKSLHALGAFYLRQGFPKQGLSLLLAAQDYGVSDPSIDRAIAHAYLLCGAPKRTIEVLDGLEQDMADERMLESARILRSRALLALGRVEDAQAVFAGTPQTDARPLSAGMRR